MMKCKNLEEVRENIDRLDEEIVRLIAERSKYVIQAVDFKKDTDEVKAPKRVEKIVKKVRGLAGENKVDPGIVENVFRVMIDSFINLELSQYRKLK